LIAAVNETLPTVPPVIVPPVIPFAVLAEFTLQPPGQVPPLAEISGVSAKSTWPVSVPPVIANLSPADSSRATWELEGMFTLPLIDRLNTAVPSPLPTVMPVSPAPAEVNRNAVPCAGIAARPSRIRNLSEEIFMRETLIRFFLYYM
jgi:hypothetical protein